MVQKSFGEDTVKEKETETDALKACNGDVHWEKPGVMVQESFQERYEEKRVQNHLHWYLPYHIITYHTISYHITSYHTISFHIILYHFISYYIISYHIIWYNIIPYHFISYHIISYHIISYHITYTVYCSYY